MSPEAYFKSNLVTSIYRPQNPVEDTVWRNPATGQDEIFSRGIWQPLTISGILSLVNGGTGADNAADARTNLGISLYSDAASDGKTYGRKDADWVEVVNAGADILPSADNTYYLGKNDDDTPFAWKGVILKDTANGKYYRIEITNGTITATDLTD